MTQSKPRGQGDLFMSDRSLEGASRSPFLWRWRRGAGVALHVLGQLACHQAAQVTPPSPGPAVARLNAEGTGCGAGEGASLGGRIPR